MFINQFTLHVVSNVSDALFQSIRLLKPGGSLLVNFACVSGYPHEGLDYGGHVSHVERWFTPIGVKRTLDKLLPQSAYTMKVYGNRISKAAYILGVGAEAFPKSALLRADPHWPVLVCVAVTRPEKWEPTYRPSDSGAGETASPTQMIAPE